MRFPTSSLPALWALPCSRRAPLPVWGCHQTTGAQHRQASGADMSCGPMAHLDSVMFLLSPWQTFSSCT